jgi:3-oxoacyl-(acyl-carrier-protein) synthase
MTNASSVVVTGTGAVCGAGMAPDAIVDAITAGRSPIRPIAQWDTTGWPCRLAAEIPTISIRARWSTIASCTSSSAAPISSGSTPQVARSRGSGIIGHRTAAG